ncbi:hypothetical protein C8R47DRAFT_1111792 [Mycena vitilis]|nr:hypothetical protein C8R47DRAFT_1111792 [Mycena vitilis]
MAACVASSSSWTASLPYPPRTSYTRNQQTPLRPTSATWNTKFPAGLDLDFPVTMPAPNANANAKPRLRLPSLASTSDLPSRRFDPFADDDAPVASTSQLPPLAPSPSPAHNPYPSQNTPPLTRGRSLTPLCITVPSSASSSASTSTTGATIVGRRRAPSFSAGANTPRAAAMGLSMAFTGSSSSSSHNSPHNSSSYGGNSLSNAPSPAPSLCRQRVSPPASPTPAPAVPLAPSPFHARHYPTPDARARLLARTLLNRIHAVGRPRSACSFSSSPYTSKHVGEKRGRSAVNGYESECGGRGYVPSRLSECVAVAVC